MNQTKANESDQIQMDAGEYVIVVWYGMGKTEVGEEVEVECGRKPLTGPLVGQRRIK